MIIPSQADVLHGARDVQLPHLAQVGPKYYSGVVLTIASKSLQKC